MREIIVYVFFQGVYPIFIHLQMPVLRGFLAHQNYYVKEPFQLSEQQIVWFINIVLFQYE